MEAVETKLCKDCGQHIEASKFRIHSLSCARQQAILKKERAEADARAAEERARVDAEDAEKRKA